MKFEITWGIFSRVPYIDIELDRDDVEVTKEEVRYSEYAKEVGVDIVLRLKPEVLDKLVQAQELWSKDFPRRRLIPGEYQDRKLVFEFSAFKTMAFPCRFTGLRDDEAKAKKVEEVTERAKKYLEERREENFEFLFSELSLRLKKNADNINFEHRHTQLALEISMDWVDEQVKDAVAVKAEIEAAKARLSSLHSQLREKRNKAVLAWLEEHNWTIPPQEDDPRIQTIRPEERKEIQSRLEKGEYFSGSRSGTFIN